MLFHLTNIKRQDVDNSITKYSANDSILQNDFEIRQENAESALRSHDFAEHAGCGG